MRDKSKHNGFIKGAFILMLFGLLSKVIGAVYRIPLTSIIGAEGMGLYQMVFPLYTLMLTISSSGLPSSISKLISENIAKNNYKQANRILSVSFILLVCFSAICSAIVFALAGVFASIQGNSAATICYYGLTPAIIIVGLISGFRGYFQGFQNMVPSAISGLIEQAIKMFAGLFLASLLVKKGVSYGVLGALIGISISEVVALVYLFIRFLISKRKNKCFLKQSQGELIGYRKTVKQILSLSIFVTLGGLIMPVTMLIDSAVIINILKTIGYTASQATTLFGLQSGTVGSIINMPVVLSLGLATAILPCVSSQMAKGDVYGAQKSASKAVLTTIIIALPSAVGCMALAEPIIRILYGKSLSVEEIKVAVGLLEVASISVFYLALVQVSAGLLQGLNRFYIPLISLGIGGLVKVVLNLLLVRIPSINILGGEVATAVCYLIALIVNLSVLKKMEFLKLDWKLLVVLLLCCGIIFARNLFKLFLMINLNYFLAFFMTIFIVVSIYFAVIFILYKPRLNKKR